MDKDHKRAPVYVFPGIAFAILLLLMPALPASGKEIKEAPNKAGNLKAVTSLGDLDETDLKRLEPYKGGINFYYFEEVSKVRRKGKRYNHLDIYFLTMLNVDFTSVNKFVVDVFSGGNNLATLKGVRKRLPNVMNFFKSFGGGGEVKMKSFPAGEYKRVVVTLPLDLKVIAKKYPEMAKNLSNRLKKFKAVIRNSKDHDLFTLVVTRKYFSLSFLVDGKGYFIAHDGAWRAIGTGPEEEMERFSFKDLNKASTFFINVDLRVKVTLLDIFQVTTIDIEDFKTKVYFSGLEESFNVKWEVVGLNLKEAKIMSANSSILRRSIENMKGTFAGRTDGWLYKNQDGNYTLLKAYLAAEAPDNWLVNSAVKTAKALGKKSMQEASQPIYDFLEALKKDIMKQPA